MKQARTEALGQLCLLKQPARNELGAELAVPRLVCQHGICYSFEVRTGARNSLEELGMRVMAKRYRNSVWFGVLALAAISALLPACRGKKPQSAPPPDLTTSTVTTPAPATTDVNPRPSLPVADSRPDPLSGELEAANRHAYQQGLLGDIYFDYDRAELTEQARGRLARNAEFLRSRPEFQVIVEGHCDERGTNEYNLALGERRANAAREYLVSLGVSAARLRTVSYGEERPQCRQSSESCWALNRRAHFVLSGRHSSN